MRLFPIALLAAALSSATSGMAQFVAKMEVKEPIEGVCDNNGVYGLFAGFKGQEPAQGPLTKA